MATLTAKIIADFTTQLATAIAVSGTTATLQSATDDDGVALPAGRYFFTLDGANSSKEHISCDLSGTSLTNIKTVSRQGTETAGVLRAHRIGASVSITDFAHILQINNLINGTTDLNASDPLKYDGTATINNANHLATKDYVDGVAIAGGADSSTTVKGITKMSVAPASAASPIAVGDNDPRVPTQAENDAMVGTSGAPSTSNKYVTNDDTAENTASKLVRRKSDSNVTVPTTPTTSTDAASKAYVESYGAYRQHILLGGIGASDYGYITSQTTVGDKLFLWRQTANSTSYQLLQYDLDTTTGNFYYSKIYGGNTTGTIATAGNFSVGIMANATYVYVTYNTNTPASYLLRFNISDITSGPTSMTFSGTAPSTASNYHPAYTDGTDLYIYSTGTTWYRYTISGTTATNAQTLTGPSMASYNNTAWSDGTYAYVYDGEIITKYALTLGASVSTITRKVITLGAGLAYVSATVMAIISYSQVSGILTVTPVTRP